MNDSKQQLTFWILSHGEIPQDRSEKLDWLHITGVFDSELDILLEEPLMRWLKSQYPDLTVHQQFDRIEYSTLVEYLDSVNKESARVTKTKTRVTA